MNISSLKEIIKRSSVGPFVKKMYRLFPIARPKYSFAQLGEDLILDHFVQYKKDGFYVDIGAYHPMDISNTHIFYKRGWSGIQVEPNSSRCNLFKRYRPQSLTLNIGIGPEQSTGTFYLFEEESLSTFSAESAELNITLGNTFLEKREVSLLPLHMVFETYAKDKIIDIMSIDTEGYDMEVLKTNDWERFRPRFIVIETVEFDVGIYGKKLNDIYDVYMKSIQYEKIADTYLNTIYTDIHGK